MLPEYICEVQHSLITAGTGHERSRNMVNYKPKIYYAKSIHWSKVN